MGPCWIVIRHAPVFAGISLTSFLLWTRECPIVLSSLLYYCHNLWWSWLLQHICCGTVLLFFMYPYTQYSFI